MEFSKFILGYCEKASGDRPLCQSSVYILKDTKETSGRFKYNEV